MLAEAVPDRKEQGRKGRERQTGLNRHAGRLECLEASRPSPAPLQQRALADPGLAMKRKRGPRAQACRYEHPLEPPSLGCSP